MKNILTRGDTRPFGAKGKKEFGDLLGHEKVNYRHSKYKLMGRNIETGEIIDYKTNVQFFEEHANDGKNNEVENIFNDDETTIDVVAPWLSKSGKEQKVNVEYVVAFRKVDYKDDKPTNYKFLGVFHVDNKVPVKYKGKSKVVHLSLFATSLALPDGHEYVDSKAIKK